MSEIKVVTADIQDVISGRFLIPFHIGLGLPRPDAESMVEVKHINSTLVIRVRKDKEVRFEPGGKHSNIECIRACCVLLNDMLPDDLEQRIPDSPSTFRLSINEWNNHIALDSMPQHWFIVHRNHQIFNCNIIISVGEEYIIIDAGTSWVAAVERVSQYMFKKEINEDGKKFLLRKDYKSVISPPNRTIEKTKQNSDVKESRVSDFMTIARSLLQ